MSFFDLNKPGVKVIRAPMGGGWAIPLTEAAKDILEDYFGEPPYAIDPLGGIRAYIVEPHDGPDLGEMLHDAGIAWVVE